MDPSGPTHFVNVYPELVVQHDISTQVDMFLVCSSPKELGKPVEEGDVTRTFTEDAYVNIVYSL